VNLIELDESIPQRNTEPRSLPSFVFIDLREDPEAWVQIESELPEDMSFLTH
jgi:hypothetical protein